MATVSHIFPFLVACTKFPEFFKTPPTFAIWMSRSKQTARNKNQHFLRHPVCFVCMEKRKVEVREENSGKEHYAWSSIYKVIYFHSVKK